MFVSHSDYQAIETVDPKEMEISSKNVILEEGKSTSHRESLSPGKGVHIAPRDQSVT